MESGFKVAGGGAHGGRAHGRSQFYMLRAVGTRRGGTRRNAVLYAAGGDAQGGRATHGGTRFDKPRGGTRRHTALGTHKSIRSAAQTRLGSIYPPLRPDICSALGLSPEVLAQAASCLVIFDLKIGFLIRKSISGLNFMGGGCQAVGVVCKGCIRGLQTRSYIYIYIYICFFCFFQKKHFLFLSAWTIRDLLWP